MYQSDSSKHITNRDEDAVTCQHECVDNFIGIWRCTDCEIPIDHDAWYHEAEQIRIASGIDIP